MCLVAAKNVGKQVDVKVRVSDSGFFFVISKLLGTNLVFIEVERIYMLWKIRKFRLLLRAGVCRINCLPIL